MPNGNIESGIKNFARLKMNLCLWNRDFGFHFVERFTQFFYYFKDDILRAAGSGIISIVFFLSIKSSQTDTDIRNLSYFFIF